MQLRPQERKLQQRFESGLKNALLLGAGGGVGFLATASTVQLLSMVLRLPASTMRGTVFGTLGIASSCVAAVYSADCAQKLAMRDPRDVFGRDDWERLEGSIAAVITGGIAFALLGGRARSLLASEYILPGAFSMKKSALPTGTLYADTREKGAIAFAGRLFGCHTCGDRKAKDYIADHMPPNKFAKKANARWYRRIFKGRLDVKQHFFPQCYSCSQVQSRAVNMETARPFKLHLAQLRLYHLTGVFIGWWWFWSWLPMLD